MYIHVYTRTHLSLCIYLYLYMYLYAIYTHARTHAHTHTHTLPPSLTPTHPPSLPPSLSVSLRLLTHTLPVFLLSKIKDSIYTHTHTHTHTHLARVPAVKKIKDSIGQPAASLVILCSIHVVDHLIYVYIHGVDVGMGPACIGLFERDRCRPGARKSASSQVLPTVVSVVSVLGARACWPGLSASYGRTFLDFPPCMYACM